MGGFVNFLSSMDPELHFGGVASFVAPKLEAAEFRKNRARATKNSHFTTKMRVVLGRKIEHLYFVGI